jgi:N-acetylglucosamine malate deacetylase 1
MIDILAIGAHPDDIEFGAGGILAKAVAEGKTVALCDLTHGDKGTNGTPKGRREEAMNAAQMLKAEREFLDFKDCEVADTYKGRLQLVEVIRKFKPRLVLAPMWKGERNHPDHIATGLLARAACRYARFSNLLPKIAPHTVEGILHYPTLTCDPDVLIDVSAYVAQWQALIECHQSQLRSRPYLDWVLTGARAAGCLIGVEYAQGLVKGNPLAIDDIMHVARGTTSL